MYRYQIDALQQWLAVPRRKPMVVRGARQVGKSTLVRLFCEAAGRQLVAVDLERQPELAAAFARVKEPRALLNLIEAAANASVGPDAVLFLDEIQAAPQALAALRYFLEDLPAQPVLAAGSLMEFTLADKAFPMPVGRVSYLHMGPMTFTEFLRGCGRENLAKRIAAFEWPSDGNTPAFDPALHALALEALQTYLFVGGMPEAVAEYAESGRLRAVSAIHADIVETFRDDFRKYAARRDLTRMLRVFNFAARHAGRKVKYSNVSEGEPSATIRRDVELLAMAQVVAKVTHSHCAGLPLQAHLKERAFKLIFLDVGLMNAICGLGWETLAGDGEDALVNAGAVAEQFVGQHLQHLLAQRVNRELVYWLREGRSNNAEVDYVVEFGGRIVPIEVRAGRAGAMKSLHQFVAEKNVELAVRLDAQPPSLRTVEAGIPRGRRDSAGDRVRYRLLSLPLYLVERLPEILRTVVATDGSSGVR